ncbi:alanine racemase [Nocardioides sp.]|uniref:alanine racemase n=1 Tax=Nocardioides sp. TaxID=35761 RepID=UPI003528E7C8
MRPPTPFLSVDRSRVEANVRRVAGWAADRGLALRPHAKTHKSPDLAAMQLAHGAVGLTVATVGEAEVFADHGATDLFVAYPLWVDAERAGRLGDLAGRVRIAIGVESPEAAAQAGRALAGRPVDVLVEVDTGHHRTGVAAAEAGRVAEAALRAGLSVRGVFSFPGHSYAPQGRAAAARDEAVALAEAAAGVRALGLDPVVSGGSTPSLAHSDASALTEVRPGVYVFGDAQQWELGACTADEIALTCRATVVSRGPGRFVVDAGSKALGADRAPWATGFGRLLDDPEARVVQLSEHHAVVECSSPPPLGSTVRLVPNHVCNAVNLADRLWVTEHDRAEDPRAAQDQQWVSWAVAARGRKA